MLFRRFFVLETVYCKYNVAYIGCYLLVCDMRHYNDIVVVLDYDYIYVYPV